MSERAPGFIGGAAAGRPVLSSLIIAFAAAALAAVAFRESEPAFADAAYSAFAAIALVVAAPALFGAAAPKNFWLRLIYAALCAGLRTLRRPETVTSKLVNVTRMVTPFELLLAFGTLRPWPSAVQSRNIGAD